MATRRRFTQEYKEQRDAVDVPEVAGQHVDAWACRNSRQRRSVLRTDAGGMRSRLRIRRMVEEPTRWPTLSSSP